MNIKVGDLVTIQDSPGIFQVDSTYEQYDKTWKQMYTLVVCHKVLHANGEFPKKRITKSAWSHLCSVIDVQS